MSAYAPERWADFAVATASVAAALAGLLFVAVSINLDVIVGDARVPSRAAQALILLVTPVFLSLCLLVPDQGRTALGVELVVLAAFVGPILGWLSRPSARSAAQPLPSWLVSGVLPAIVLLVAPLVAGYGLLTTSLGGLYWVPLAVVVALVGGLLNAWSLLIEIVR